ncbi:MAG: ribonuclease III [Candidatus Firestonebacteria bacterium]|nr:ribonuclease III [Candidatus Firestonebacteria bacterium]
MINENRKNQLNELENKINIHFNDINILNRALTHRSFANEFKEKKILYNENLEFLGDAVLGLIISEYIYRKFPSYNEGDLSKLKSVIVSRSLLANYGQELGISKFLMLGKGEKITGGNWRASIAANTVEALIGAIYLDSNLEKTKDFVLKELKEKIDLACDEKFKKDYKSIIQEYTQSKFKQKPIYKVIQEKGPDHIKEFKVQVSINDRVYGIGEGHSKKEAEQEAAYFALINFKEIAS